MEEFVSPQPVATLPPPPTPRQSGVACSTQRPARVEAFGLSHKGLVRPSNEDGLLVVPELGLYAVADGMGGKAAGEVASRMTLDAVRCAFEDADVTWPGAMTDLPAPAPGLPQLVAAVERANVRVHAAASADNDMAGMGTTVTALLLLGGRLAVAHVGDSRLYRLRGGHLEQLTRDHTYVERCVRLGIMTREQAAQSEHKHIITRAIGTDPEVRVDRGVIAIEPGDAFLLATDGLHGVVGNDDIAATLLAWPDLTRAATRLIEATLDAGAPDNVSVVIVRIS
jgi:protein phosphatase